MTQLLEEPTGLDCDLAEICQKRDKIDRESQKQRVAQRESRCKAGQLRADANSVQHCGKMNEASPETYAHYALRGSRLFGDFCREENIRAGNEEYCLQAFAEWLLGKRPFWADGTWRSVRAAATFFISRVPDNDAEEASALIEAAGQPLLRESNPDRTVACLVRYDDFEKIRDRARQNTRSENASWLADFMLAGVATGLGPDEWRLTKLAQTANRSGGERVQLYVFDLRCSRPGVPGSYRTLDVSTFSVEVREAIRRLSDQGRDWAASGQFASRKHAISTLLSETAGPLFPEKHLNYTLDSFQYQAIANFQTLYNHKREEISALLGDLFIGVQTPNYAHRDRSWTASCIPGHPRPAPSAVRRFGRILKIYDDRNELWKLRKRRR